VPPGECRRLLGAVPLGQDVPSLCSDPVFGDTIPEALNHERPPLRVDLSQGVKGHSALNERVEQPGAMPMQ
jgi:hypothetical protein